MKRLSVLLMSLFSVFGLAAADAYSSVSVVEFAKVLEDSTVVRLDVRTPAEYAEGHIIGALLIDVNAADFLEKAKVMLPKDKTIALYCRSGRRSKRAADLLTQAGYKVVELNSGWLGWMAEGMPVEK